MARSMKYHSHGRVLCGVRQVPPGTHDDSPFHQAEVEHRRHIPLVPPGALSALDAEASQRAPLG
jgi:hypothetical protein